MDNKNHTNDHEYEYRGLCVNGFLMIFFTFILLPALMILAIVKGGEDNPGLSVGVTIPLFILFVLGCVGYFTQEPNVARVMIFFGMQKGRLLLGQPLHEPQETLTAYPQHGHRAD